MLSHVMAACSLLLAMDILQAPLSEPALSKYAASHLSIARDAQMPLSMVQPKYADPGLLYHLC